MTATAERTNTANRPATNPTAIPVHHDPSLRHDFVLYFDVLDGNPNGDPDNSNFPRMDSETMHGLVTDAAIKRKIRNYVLEASKHQDDDTKRRNNIYIEADGVLNSQHRKAYVALGLNTSEPITDPVPDPKIAAQLDELELPSAFTYSSEDKTLTYTGELSVDELKEVLAAIHDENPKVAAFIKSLTKKSKAVRLQRNGPQLAGVWMAENHFDVRMFGAVMSTNINAGKFTGPFQLGMARSVDPINPVEVTISRVAVTKEEDKEKKSSDFGRKMMIPYGLYRVSGHFSPAHARNTGVTRADMELLWQAIINCFDLDRSAGRGEMAAQSLIVFTHELPLGNAPAQKLFKQITATKRTEIPRSFDDYEVIFNDAQFEGITTTTLI